MWRVVVIVMLVSVARLSIGKSHAAPVDSNAFCCKPVCGGCFAP